jgi:hypothetical protein
MHSSSTGGRPIGAAFSICTTFFPLEDPALTPELIIAIAAYASAHGMPAPTGAAS